MDEREFEGTLVLEKLAEIGEGRLGFADLGKPVVGVAATTGGQR